VENLVTFSISVFTGFFAIMNPISNLPIFITLLDGADKQTKQRVNIKAVIIAFIIVSTFVILGKFIFELFGITIPAFKITGGILIFYVGFEMLQSKKSSVKHLQDTNFDENIAVSPLAIPLLAGPGTIVTAMNFVPNTSYIHIGLVILIFGLMCVLTYITFTLSDLIVKKIGANVISVIGKLMGLILAIIGTGMVIEGIKISFDLTK
jgi:multiple antibiotic resistance protein